MKTYNKKQYISSKINIIRLENETPFLAGSPTVSPEKLEPNNQEGSGIQLSKKHSTIWDDDAEDEW